MSIGNVIWAKFDLNISQQNTEHFSIKSNKSLFAYLTKIQELS